ncbi:flippase [Egicoccus sp. AB-alg2]|uniref:flippase n=1 Tax=Egicoccus sp. AB-alg2 TaxID=3242693 RepID=UPI00359E7928
MAASAEPHVLHAAKGIGYLTAGGGVGQVVRFVTAILLARALGADGLGQYMLALTVAGLCSSLAALGLDDAMVRYLAIQAREGNRSAVAGTLQIGVGISTLVGTITGVGLFVAAGAVADRVFDAPELVPVLRAFGVIVPFMTLSNALLGVARGSKRMDVAALAEEVVQSLVRLALILPLLFLGLEPVAAAVVFGVGDVASSLTMVALLRRQLPLRAAFGRGVRRDVRGLVGFAGPLWLAGALRKFRQNIETLLLGSLTAVASVGIFSVAAKVNLVGHTVYSAIITSVKPHLAELHGSRDREGLRHLYRTTTRWALLFGLPFCLVTVLYAEPILAVFGDSFTAGTTALVVLAAGELVNAATGVCGSVLDMARRTGAKLVNAVLWLVLILGANLLLIPRWGVLGAAVASVLASSLINVLRIVQVWVLERVHPYDRTFLKPAAAGVGAFAFGAAVARVWSPADHPLVLAVQAGLVVAVYALLVVLLRPEAEDAMVAGRVWGRVRRLPGQLGRSLRPARAAERV